ncbi:MAG: DotU family type IV/VI secretion system protein [Planctomycetaceae bacterium]|nr:DotU family type IV/VI secretion system protein [Planctomycetaceae bacterium]
MTPRFSKAIDPIFVYVIQLLERIESNEPLAPHDEQALIISRLERAEGQLGFSQEWQLAKYALVAWIDEVLIAAAWDGNEWWENNVLERQLFNSREANERFFENARLASAMHSKDAYEVYYVCVVLGFHGVYRNEHELGNAEYLLRLGLPTTREIWAKQVRVALHLGEGRPPMITDSREGDGAPPLEKKFACISAWLVVLVLAAIVGLLIGWDWERFASAWGR